MSDMRITGLASKITPKENAAKHQAEQPRTIQDFAAMLRESIEERRQMALAAAMSGTTVQQQILGISDEEWKRLDIANSSLVKTDEEKKSEEENASPLSADPNDTGGSAANDTETISRVLGDGSTLIITTRGNQVVSTQKIAPDEIIVANPNYIAPEDGGVGAAARKTVTRTVSGMSFF